MKSVKSVGSLKSPKGASSRDGDNHWIITTKTMLLNSPQWKALTHEIYGLIQRDLKKSHVTFFSDLSEKERSMFIDRAQRSVSKLPVYQIFEDMLFEVSFFQVSRHFSHSL